MASNGEIKWKCHNDSIFQQIDHQFLTLKEDNDQYVKMIEDVFIPEMRRRNKLFDATFQRILFGGSYYKGTKVGKPDEFDLDFIIKLPINYDNITIDVNHNNYGFVKIKMDAENIQEKRYRDVITNWINSENHLIESKFRRWFESVFTLAFSGLSDYPNRNMSYKMRHKKSGPAFTLTITTSQQSEINIDLVPCLKFDKSLSGYRSMNGKWIKRQPWSYQKNKSSYNESRSKPIPNPLRRQSNANQKSRKQSWYAVAKPQVVELGGRTYAKGEDLWRLCFYEQERNFLKSRGQVKPMIRMMKKLRDTNKMENISSYYIETIFYTILSETDANIFSDGRACNLCRFKYVLEKLRDAIQNGYIPYFWHSGHNLLRNIGPATLENHANRLTRLISMFNSDIEKKLVDIVLVGSN